MRRHLPFLLSAGALCVLVLSEFQHETYLPFLLAAAFALAASVAALRDARSTPWRFRAPALAGLALVAGAVVAYFLAAGRLATQEQDAIASGLRLVVWVAPLVAAGAVSPLLARADAWSRAGLLAAPVAAAASALLSTAILRGVSAPVPLVGEVDALTLAGLLLGLAACARMARAVRGRPSDAAAPAA